MVRIKERYLLVNILYPPASAKPAQSSVPDLIVHHQPTIERLTPQALLKAIRTEVSTLFGDYGAGAIDGRLSVKYLSLATSTFILKCSRAHYKLVWSALTFMDHVPVRDGRECIFRVVRVSGTIRKAEEEAIRQAKKIILAAKEDSESSRLLFADTSQEQDQVMADINIDTSDDDMDAEEG
ncbi:Ribonuclease P/MRP protein subunit POP5 [Paramyrothecium foliicola]|nr:Ribonuclease P/MRP protein subunit POP5 [Paramyrothecium foliicola]